MKIEKLLPWLALGIGGYFVWKLQDKLKTGAGDAAAAIYKWLHANVNVRGKLVLPDNTLYPFTNVSTYWVGSQLRVKIGATEYQIHPHDERGNYPATKV